MSVTFFIPDAPTEKWEPYPDEEPGYLETRPVAPFTEVNMCNRNAYDLMAIMDPAGDPSGGRWEVDKLYAVFRRIMMALNRDDTVSSLILAERQEGNLYEGGRDVDYITRRLTDMANLVRVAIQHKMPVSYG